MSALCQAVVLVADRVIVFSAGPGRVLEDMKIDLGRPRSYTGPAFNEYRVRLTAHMEREVMRSQEAELAAT
jgi:NitT/TauT family transport system ATP-binding protein/sulfonate transport system ATP-binding protein